MLDVIVFAPHPDDAELGAGGAIVKATKSGLKVGIIDLTAGEKATFGTQDIRLQEATMSKKVLGVEFRENLGFPDAFLPFLEHEKPVFTITTKIRQYQPEIVLIPFWRDRHPDHIASSQIITKAIHYAKLAKIELEYPMYKVPLIVYYELNGQFTPSYLMDISDEFELKRKAIMCFKSQFKEFSKEYLPFPVEERNKYYGSLISVDYAEAFLLTKPIKIKDWDCLFK